MRIQKIYLDMDGVLSDFNQRYKEIFKQKALSTRERGEKHDDNWNQFVEVDEKYERPTEVDALIGDPSKAKAELGWSAQTKWDELAKLMVDADLKSLNLK